MLVCAPRELRGRVLSNRHGTGVWLGAGVASLNVLHGMLAEQADAVRDPPRVHVAAGLATYASASWPVFDLYPYPAFMGHI